MRLVSIIFAVVLFGLGSSFAQAKFTSAQKEEKCIQMVNDAIAHIKKVGADQAYKDFMVKNGNWTVKLSDDVLYVFVNDFEGVNLAHGAKPQLVGQNLNGLKDSKGVQFFTLFLQTAKTDKGSGWVEYYWQNLASKKDDLKKTYIKKVPDLNTYVGVGYTKLD